ncbi:MAG TPA: class III poly(R)-hydroxyalkanoic acid synthase subunit PhaC [Anaerolineae bacterium]|nr:class III poly(R)-hydroxyalkanoic acid synthase subunit PhaC [Anaerolineae bacterium]
MFPIQINPAEAAQEMMQWNQQIQAGLENLTQLRDNDILYGQTPKDEVYRDDNVVLYRYRPVVEELWPVPLLISYALVNRPYMVDLQDNRSLVRNLLNLGIDVYIIDWGYPERGDRWLTLDDYINGYLDGCVEHILDTHDIDNLNLLGICEGGAFSLCYTSIHPDKVKNLITMVTPVDFNVPEGMLNLWSGCKGGGAGMDVDLMVDAMGNIPGDFMNFGFLMLKPFQLNVDKYLQMGNILDDESKLENFMRMEKWIFDSPDQAGEAFRQFISDFFQQNKLIKGEVMIGDHKIDLGQIKQPVLNVYAELDHLVPPDSSRALEQYIGSKDYTVASFPVGHIGMYVSGKVQAKLPPTIADWLKAH